MEIPLFLAISPQEMASCATPPKNTAWLSCHFSEEGAGLEDIPISLPENSFLIIDDSAPICNHDPALVSEQMKETVLRHRCKGVLLDFQRPHNERAEKIIRQICRLPCPVGVSEPYAAGLDCPIFLPPIPVDCSPKEYLKKWKGREIWLDTSYSPTRIVITANGCAVHQTPLTDTPLPHRDDRLCCHYSISTSENQIIFLVQRTQEDIYALMKKSIPFGATHAFGLYQELADSVR